MTGRCLHGISRIKLVLQHAGLVDSCKCQGMNWILQLQLENGISEEVLAEAVACCKPSYVVYIKPKHTKVFLLVLNPHHLAAQISHYFSLYLRTI